MIHREELPVLHPCWPVNTPFPRLEKGEQEAPEVRDFVISRARCKQEFDIRIDEQSSLCPPGLRVLDLVGFISDKRSKHLQDPRFELEVEEDRFLTNLDSLVRFRRQLGAAN